MECLKTSIISASSPAPGRFSRMLPVDSIQLPTWFPVSRRFISPAGASFPQKQRRETAFLGILLIVLLILMPDRRSLAEMLPFSTKNVEFPQNGFPAFNESAFLLILPGKGPYHHNLAAGNTHSTLPECSIAVSSTRNMLKYSFHGAGGTSGFRSHSALLAVNTLMEASRHRSRHR